MLRLPPKRKKLDTIVTEGGHSKRWIEVVGHLRLDKIRAHHISAYAQLFTMDERLGHFGHVG